MSSPQGNDHMVLRLASEGTVLTGEISGARLGTHEITDGRIEGSTLSWAVVLTDPFDIKLEMSVNLVGDRFSGESLTGRYGVTSVYGERGNEADWSAHPDRHSHRSPVHLPDGTTIVAVSYEATDPYGRELAPDFGLYLDPRWAPPWDHDHLDWPDFGLPAAPEEASVQLGALLERARQGQSVEIGCLGGHGRTGTALAWLAVLCGVPPEEAVSWVRANYCERAVELEEQEAFIAGLGS